MTTAPVDVTVVIPTLDGERYLARVLDAIDAQEFGGTVEVLVIDSGSTDRTIEIAGGRSTVRVHEIPNSEFGHGRTRNLGARLARGRVVAFLTQDAIPATEHWLAELTGPLRDDRVAGVVGRQIPRPGCFPLLKYEIVDTFRAIGPDDATTISSLGPNPTPGALDRASFYSDVNSAARRALLTETIPYRDVDYSEDRVFARDALLAGYRIAYVGGAAVEHSNDLTLRSYRARVEEEVSALLRSGVALRHHGTVARALRWGWGVLRDSARIVRDPDFSPAQRALWLIRNPAYHAAKWRGYGAAFRGVGVGAARGLSPIPPR